MTREEAYYKRIQLLCGFWDDYDKWLDSYLETEEPLSNIVLQLLDCHSDMKEGVYHLNLYCQEQPFDEDSVYVKLRMWVRDEYKKGIFTLDQLMSALFRFSQKIPFCDFSNQCGLLSDHYVLSKEGIVDMALFQAELTKWLNDGGTIDTNKFWR